MDELDEDDELVEELLLLDEVLDELVELLELLEVMLEELLLVEDEDELVELLLDDDELDELDTKLSSRAPTVIQALGVLSKRSSIVIWPEVSDAPMSIPASRHVACVPQLSTLFHVPNVKSAANVGKSVNGMISVNGIATPST
jgi:hypothetical protein